ncbi:hypothetical protein VIAQ111709_10435 [Vibrio aquimaris]|uniref:Uncharacterized protein n=1 Tax=Vibrio aquimaris TaxID=2587862 RepID=A0A5P9CJU2_9VIBR|nr:hypothetical protein FIV01_09130 [Vibrio aquimaris]
MYSLFIPSFNKHRKIKGPKEIKLDRLHDSANSL